MPERRTLTWAETYAHDFEGLALEYVRDHFKLPIVDSHTTAKTRDDGIDGVLLFDVAPALGLHGMLVVEAKLREPGSAPVGVDVVRSTFLVAMFKGAQYLALVTNTRYSLTAHEELHRFEDKWGLQATILEGDGVAEWLDRTSADGYPRELTGRLKEPHAGSGRPSAPRKYKPSKSRPEIVDDVEAVVAKYPLTGERNAVLTTTLNTLSADPVGGIVTVGGMAGTGKTVLLTHAAHELRRRGWKIEILRVAHLHTVLNFFNHMVLSVTGLDRAALVGPTVALVVEKFLTGTLGVSPAAANDFAAALRDGERSTRPQPADYTLLEFITAIIKKSPGKAPKAFVFSDLGGSSAEVLHFTKMLATQLSANGVTSLVEMPPFEFTEAETFAEGWRQSVRTIDHVALGAFTDTEIDEFFGFYKIRLQPSELRSVVEVFGRNPLCLRRVAAEIAAGSVLSTLRATSCDALIDQAIGALVRRRGDAMLRVCIASALLGGYLPRDLAEPLTGSMSYAAIADEPTTASVFRRLPRGLECDHQRILSGLERLARERPETAREVGEMLLRTLSAGDARRLPLLRVTEQWKEFVLEALRHGRLQSRGRELTSSGILITEAYQTARQKLADTEPEAERLRLETLIELANSESLQVYLGLEESVNAERQAQVRAGLSSGMFAAVLPPSLVITAYESVWRVLFAGEAFEDALPLSAEASEYANRKAPDNELLRTRARRMYAFTLRAAGRPEESIAQLVALNAGDGAGGLVNAHIATLAAAGLLNSEPLEAAALYLRASQQFERSDESFIEYIRSLVDISLADYSAGQWMQAGADAERARHHAEAARLSIEAGRASNVIACVEWVRGNADRAISIWRELTTDLMKSRATWPQRRLAWRYWSNFASAQMRGVKSEAVLAASNAVEIILADSAQRLPLMRHAKYRETRWYAALLAAAVVLKSHAPDRWDELWRRVEEQVFNDDVDMLLGGSLPSGIFGRRAFEESATLLITG